jgi:hypothetical protein
VATPPLALEDWERFVNDKDYVDDLVAATPTPQSRWKQKTIVNPKYMFGDIKEFREAFHADKNAILVRLAKFTTGKRKGSVVRKLSALVEEKLIVFALNCKFIGVRITEDERTNEVSERVSGVVAAGSDAAL